MPLKLSLKPGERFVVNGAVLQNGDRRAVLLLQNKASILREKDIIQPEEANTPVRRIYFPIMMMYLDPAGAAGILRRIRLAHERVHGRHPPDRHSQGMRLDLSRGHGG